MARKWQRMGGVVVAGLLASCGGGGGGSSDTTECATVATDVADVIPIAASSIAKLALLESRAAPVQVESLRSQGGGESARQPRTDRQLRTNSISLGALSEAKLADADATEGQGVPHKVGLARELLQTASVAGMAALWDWQSTTSGGKVAAISFSATDAKGLRLGLLVRSLPAGATLRIYAQSAATAYVVAASDVLASVQRNLATGDTSDAARTYWTPLVEGTEATLEIELPAQVGTEGVQIAVPRLSHLFATPTADDTSQARATAGSCEVNVACNTSYNTESNAVARMLFTSAAGVSSLCSGTLVNDKNSTGTPYFLSANHCISKQIEASSLETFWFYKASTCSSSILNPASTSLVGGANLLYTSAITDTSFMQLLNTPPAGATFAGWTLETPTQAATVAGIHHPQGDLQKISTGTVSGFQNCSVLNASSLTYTCSTSTAAASKFVSVTYTSGVTEAGSSGSPLFQTSGSSRYLIGQLYGGTSSCSNPQGTNNYGRFDVAYNAGVSQWLNGTASASLVVATAGNGSGTVSSAPSGISCGAGGSACAAPFAIGSSVVLTATPASGSSFNGWSGACAGSSNTCTLSMGATTNATASFTVPTITLATALDGVLAWVTGGDAVFFGQTTTSRVGGSAAQSGKIGNSQRSTLSTTVTGPGTLAFDWKVSSERGYDFFTVAVDGVDQFFWSGPGDWSSTSLALTAGSHTVTWTYAKDLSGSSGEDAGWVDKVVFTPTTAAAATCTKAAAAK